MPRLVLPPSLCELCSLPRELTADGATAAEALANAARAHPELGRRLLDAAGRPRSYYSLFKNDAELRDLEAALAPDDILTVLPPVAGGVGEGEEPKARLQSPGATPAWLAAVIAHCEAAYPEEACGLVLRREDGALESVGARNVADDPRLRFELDPRLVLDAVLAGRLHGFYHSHPDGEACLSAEDLRKAAPWGSQIEWTVVAVRAGHAGETRTFRLEKAAR